MATKSYRNDEHRKLDSMENSNKHATVELTNQECFKLLDDMGLASRYGIRLIDGKLTHNNKDGYFLS